MARTRGESTGYVVVREILPNIAGPMLADLGLRFVYVVLLLASLSFVGLGVAAAIRGGPGGGNNHGAQR